MGWGLYAIEILFVFCWEEERGLGDWWVGKGMGLDRCEAGVGNRLDTNSE